MKPISIFLFVIFIFTTKAVYSNTDTNSHRKTLILVNNRNFKVVRIALYQELIVKTKYGKFHGILNDLNRSDSSSITLDKEVIPISEIRTIKIIETGSSHQIIGKILATSGATAMSFAIILGGYSLVLPDARELFVMGFSGSSVLMLAGTRILGKKYNCNSRFGWAIDL